MTWMDTGWLAKQNENRKFLSTQNTYISLDTPPGTTHFGGVGSICRRDEWWLSCVVERTRERGGSGTLRRHWESGGCLRASGVQHGKSEEGRATERAIDGGSCGRVREWHWGRIGLLELAELKKKKLYTGASMYKRRKGQSWTE